jgi:hypothetical protein
MQFLLLIPVLAVLVLEVFFLYKVAANRKRAKLIASTAIVKVAELSGGQAKVQGQVLGLGDPLAAPLSGRPCVYYRFQVEEKKMRHGPPPHGGGSYWKTIINDVQSIPCGLDDGTGVVASTCAAQRWSWARAPKCALGSSPTPLLSSNDFSASATTVPARA